MGDDIYLAPGATNCKCDIVTFDDVREAARTIKAHNLTDHPDLREFDQHADRFYA